MKSHSFVYLSVDQIPVHFFFLFLIEFTGFADIIYVFIIWLRTRDIYYADGSHLPRPLPPSVEINFILVFRYSLLSYGQFIMSHETEMGPFFFLFFFFLFCKMFSVFSRHIYLCTRFTFMWNKINFTLYCLL